MKLATYEKDLQQGIGAVVDDGAALIDLKAAAGAESRGYLDSMLSLIEAGADGMAIARMALERAGPEHRIAMADVKLLAPLPVPPQMRDASVYPLHVRQAPAGMQKLAARLQGQPEPDTKLPDDVPAVYRDLPIYYITNRFSVIGPEATVTWPRYSKFMDFELEFAAVIGRRGKNISREDAFDHVFGYTIFNDFSARDAQLKEMQGMLGPAKGKSFDSGNALGPWIVTRDEIPDPQALKVEVRVNGTPWMTSDTSGMLHGFDAIIAHVSADETLHPGEVIGSGTVGNCCGLEQNRYLQSGDIVELEVEGIGTLRNMVVAQG